MFPQGDAFIFFTIAYRIPPFHLIIIFFCIFNYHLYHSVAHCSRFSQGDFSILTAVYSRGKKNPFFLFTTFCVLDFSYSLNLLISETFLPCGICIIGTRHTPCWEHIHTYGELWIVPSPHSCMGCLSYPFFRSEFLLSLRWKPLFTHIALYYCLMSSKWNSPLPC